MINRMCFIQDGQLPSGKVAALQTRLSSFSEVEFGAPAQINWVTVPKGSGFSGGHPSTSSVVSMTAEKPLEQERRVALLHKLCDLWIEETGCSPDELVGVINDPTRL